LCSIAVKSGGRFHANSNIGGVGGVGFGHYPLDIASASPSPRVASIARRRAGGRAGGRAAVVSDLALGDRRRIELQ